MIHGLSGALLSHDALARQTSWRRPASEAAIGQIVRWHRSARQTLGPTASARMVFDRIAAPLFAQLGCTLLPGPAKGPHVHATIAAGSRPAAALLVTAWEWDLRSAWRHSVRHGIGEGLRWCIAMNGPALRILDARRTYSRRYAQFDLATAFEDRETCSLLCALLHAEALSSDPGSCAMDAAVAVSEQFRTQVRASLQHGVHSALVQLLGAFSRAAPGNPADLSVGFGESLTVVYRILFLLFAEARGLAPRWHPTYRESYTIESLRELVEASARPRGLWEALQAIARLAHRGCRAGSLQVPPFNGRLFSPAEAPLADSVTLDDGAVREALLALTTCTTAEGRRRISYGDLGVEQLGGVYERLLGFRPEAVAGAPALVPAVQRKATGAFYTPRSLTEYLVRRTLAPLVEDASADRILALRVLDPAMGSGAFLVAACRYLASAYEQALLREGAMGFDDADRAVFRRIVAQRCLYGVDVNPMAVRLGRLSLWLATLAADRPLTFLDHHLRAGNSIVGASIDDLLRQSPGRSAPAEPLPLFESEALDAAVASAVAPRIAIACEPGDTLDQVRAKERDLALVDGANSPMGRWRRAADLWCAGWFTRASALQSRATYGALVDEILHDNPRLPPHLSGPLHAEAAAAAKRLGCFHWTLEFPEAFFSSTGEQLANPGFDAVVSNPPWAVLRGERGDEAERRSAHAEAIALTAFARTAGIYRHQGSGHANLYQLFLERCLALTRRGGHVGLVLPSGFANDTGCSGLRRHLLDRFAVETFVGIENRDGVFPIHRALKFLLLTARAGARTETLPCRAGVRSPDVLESMPEIGSDRSDILVPRALLQQTGDGDYAIPELRDRDDLSVFSAIAGSVPALGSTKGWHVRFGRELNVTDDRKHFTESPSGLPVVEGKQVRPFAVDLCAARHHVPRAVAATLLDPERSYEQPRLAYRDVASATNRLTLIAAIVPSGAVTTHTLFCLRDEPREDVHLFLCGVFNSYVANYLVRLRVGTHVTTAIVQWLPVPSPARNGAAFAEVVRHVRRLLSEPSDLETGAALQALCARLYGLTFAGFRHIVRTFPLVDVGERRRALEIFAGMAPGSADFQ